MTFLMLLEQDIQVNEFKDYIQSNFNNEETSNMEIVLWKLEMKKQDFIGKTIRESNIREITNEIVVGIEKSGRRILNPESNCILEERDILWIVGNKDKIKSFIE